MTWEQLDAFAEILDMFWLAAIYAIALWVFGGMTVGAWKELRRK